MASMYQKWHPKENRYRPWGAGRLARSGAGKLPAIQESSIGARAAWPALRAGETPPL